LTLLRLFPPSSDTTVIICNVIATSSSPTIAVLGKSNSCTYAAGVAISAPVFVAVIEVSVPPVPAAIEAEDLVLNRVSNDEMGHLLWIQTCNTIYGL
jgi:hypothetical protein